MKSFVSNIILTPLTKSTTDLLHNHHPLSKKSILLILPQLKIEVLTTLTPHPKLLIYLQATRIAGVICLRKFTKYLDSFWIIAENVVFGNLRNHLSFSPLSILPTSPAILLS